MLISINSVGAGGLLYLIDVEPAALYTASMVFATSASAAESSRLAL